MLFIVWSGRCHVLVRAMCIPFVGNVNHSLWNASCGNALFAPIHEPALFLRETKTFTCKKLTENLASVIKMPYFLVHTVGVLLWESQSKQTRAAPHAIPAAYAEITLMEKQDCQFSSINVQWYYFNGKGYFILKVQNSSKIVIFF